MGNAGVGFSSVQQAPVPLPMQSGSTLQGGGQVAASHGGGGSVDEVRAQLSSQIQAVAHRITALIAQMGGAPQPVEGVANVGQPPMPGTDATGGGAPAAPACPDMAHGADPAQTPSQAPGQQAPAKAPAAVPSATAAPAKSTIKHKAKAKAKSTGADKAHGTDKGATEAGAHKASKKSVKQGSKGKGSTTSSGDGDVKQAKGGTSATATAAATGTKAKHAKQSAGTSTDVQQTSPAAKATNKGMEVAVEDDRVFVETAEGDPLRNAAFDKAKAMKATVIRANVYWGKQAQDPAYLQKFDSFVNEAKRRGFAVELTLTGGADDWTGGKGVNPKAADYGKWTGEMASHFTALGVERYSLWNEPNHGAFLAAGPQGAKFQELRATGKAKSAEAARTTDPRQKAALQKELKSLLSQASKLFASTVSKDNAQAYNKLVRAGKAGIDKVAPDAHVLVGELSSRNAQQFMRQMTRGGKIVADGFALHPYQMTVNPNQKANGRSDGGIGRLKEVQSTLKSLAADGRLATEDGKKLPLYLTEFGYQKQEGRSNGRSLSEAKRAKWEPMAFEIAQQAGVKQMLHYQLVESADPAVAWDTSILEPNATTANRTYDELATWAATNVKG